MKVIKGDLIKLAKTGEFDVIVHGCNCRCVMGAGIALSIKRTFPEAYAADLNTTSGDSSKLGTINFIETTNDSDGGSLFVVNGYTQYNYGNANVFVDYKAVRDVFSKVKNSFTGLKIGYPMIGCGYGGGDWNIVSKIIDEELQGEDHVLVLL